MKKLLLSIAALLVIGLAYFSESSFVKQESMSEMTEFYNESTKLQQLSNDSIERFIVKVRGFTMTNPQAEYDPLYPIKRTFQAGRMAEMKSKEFQREIQSEIKEKSKGNPKEVQR